MKIMVVYDSVTGNTEKMAKAIAEGAESVDGMVVEVKKIGDPFPLTMVSNADGVLFGSPSTYANVTEGMRMLMENMKACVKTGRIDFKGKNAAVFGSYGWDGAWVMEEKLKGMVQELGFKVQEEVNVETSTNIKYHADENLENSKEFGKTFAENLKKA